MEEGPLDNKGKLRRADCACMAKQVIAAKTANHGRVE